MLNCFWTPLKSDSENLTSPEFNLTGGPARGTMIIIIAVPALPWNTWLTCFPPSPCNRKSLTVSTREPGGVVVSKIRYLYSSFPTYVALLTVYSLQAKTKRKEVRSVLASLVVNTMRTQVLYSLVIHPCQDFLLTFHSVTCSCPRDNLSLPVWYWSHSEMPQCSSPVIFQRFWVVRQYNCFQVMIYCPQLLWHNRVLHIPQITINWPYQGW